MAPFPRQGSDSPAPRSTAENRAQELLEKSELEAGKLAIEKILQRQTQTVRDLRSRFPLEDADLLSDRVSRLRDIPNEVRIEIARLGDKMRTVIEDVASSVGDGAYRAYEEKISSDKSIGLKKQQQAHNLLTADKRRFISCKSLEMAIGICTEINQDLSCQVEGADRKKEANLILLSSILVYELTSFVIKFIRDFTQDGIDEINRIYAGEKRKLKDARSEVATLRRQAAGPHIHGESAQRAIQDLDNRDKSISIIEEEWDTFVGEGASFKSAIADIHGMLPTLELNRDMALNQIHILERVAVLAILKDNIKSLCEGLSALSNLEPIPLSPERVRRLLGLENAEAMTVDNDELARYSLEELQSLLSQGNDPHAALRAAREIIRRRDRESSLVTRDTSAKRAKSEKTQRATKDELVGPLQGMAAPAGNSSRGTFHSLVTALLWILTALLWVFTAISLFRLLAGK